MIYEGQQNIVVLYFIDKNVDYINLQFFPAYLTNLDHTRRTTIKAYCVFYSRFLNTSNKRPLIMKVTETIAVLGALLPNISFSIAKVW